MPIIPKFERQKLASSLVGTPGVDNSGAAIAEAVGGVGQKAMQVFGQQAIEKKNIQDQALANKTLVDFDVELEKAYIDHQKNYKTDPLDKTDFLKDNAQNLLDSFTAGIADPQVRGAVERAGYARIGEKVVGAAKWADQQATQNTIDATTSTNDKLANEAYIAGMNNNQTRAAEVLKSAEENIAAAKLVLGEKDSQKLRKNVAQGYISGLMEQHPEELKAMLDRGDFKNVLEPEEAKKLKTDAVAQIERAQQTAETTYFADHIAQYPQQWEKLKAGTLTYSEIEQIDDPTIAKHMKEIWLKGQPYTPEDKRDKFMNLYGETMELIKGQGTAAYTKGSLQDVIKLQGKILGAAREGSISADDASSLLKRFAVPTTKALKKADDWFGIFNGMSEPYKRAYAGVQADAKKYNLTPSTQASILVEFDQQLGKLAENPDKPTAAETDLAYRTAYQEIIRKVNPSLLKTTELPNAVGSQAAGVQPISDGKPTAKADRSINPPAPAPIVYTESDLKFTAKKYGITVEEVKKRLGVKDNANNG